MDPLGTHKRKRSELLREVYKENLRIADQDVPEEPSDGTPRRSLIGGILALVVLLALIGAGFLFQYVRSDATTAQARTVAGDSSLLPVDDVLGAAEPLAGDASAESLSVAGHFQSMASESGPSIAALFGLEIQTIVLDPGHGGRDPGAIGAAGAQEKVIALDIARRLKRRLEVYDLQVLMTRTGDARVPLQARAAFANAHQADLFVSIHVNELPVESVVSVETYYFGAGSDERARQLAREENRGSDYSIADFRRIIDRLENTLRLQESQRLAHSIQSELFSTLDDAYPEMADWGVKTAPFVVLLGTKAPSILTEVGVLSNREAEQRLQTDRHREHVAGALEQGILTYLRRRGTTMQPTEIARHGTHHGR